VAVPTIVVCVSATVSVDVSGFSVARLFVTISVAWKICGVVLLAEFYRCLDPHRYGKLWWLGSPVQGYFPIVVITSADSELVCGSAFPESCSNH